MVLAGRASEYVHGGVARAQPGVTTIALVEKVGSEPARRRGGPPRHDRDKGDASTSCRAAGPSPRRAHVPVGAYRRGRVGLIKKLRYESIFDGPTKRPVCPPHQVRI